MRTNPLITFGALLITTAIVSAQPTQGTPYSAAVDNAAMPAAEASAIIANLQPQLQRLYMLLQTVNSSPGRELSPAVPVPQQGPAPAAPGQPFTSSGAALGANVTTNTSTRLGANISANLSVPAGATAAANTASPVPPAVSPPGRPSVPQAPQGIAPTTSRALVALQQELHRVLPLVASINRDQGFARLASTGGPAGNPETDITVKPGATRPAQFPTPTGRPTPPGNVRSGPGQ